MKHPFLSLAILTLGTCLQAEFILNPDSNTLWLEDGKNIAVSNTIRPRTWLNDSLDLKPLPDKQGFSIDSIPGSKGHSTLRYVPCNKDYPWLVFKISDVQQKRGYIGLDLWITGPGRRGYHQVAHLTDGLVAFKPLMPPATGTFPLVLYLYNATLNLTYVKAVKEPENYVFAEAQAFSEKRTLKKGDAITFTAKLAKPVEDVTIRLFNPYMMRPMYLNQQDKIQLKPTDGVGRFWSATVTIDSLTGSPEHKSILMKAVVLGSEDITYPLWGPIHSSFR